MTEERDLRNSNLPVRLNVLSCCSVATSRCSFIKAMLAGGLAKGFAAFSIHQIAAALRNRPSADQVLQTGIRFRHALPMPPSGMDKA